MQARNVSAPLLRLAIMLLGDGWVENDRVGYSSKDITLLNYFSRLVKEISGKKPKIRMGDRAWRSVLYSTNLVKRLKELSPSFRTKKFPNGEFPPAKIPDVVFTLPKDEIAEILRLIFSMEGGVALFARKVREGYYGVERKVFLSSANPILAEQYIRLIRIVLGDIKIKYDKKARNLYIRNFTDIEKFAEKIGFIPGVKVSHSASRWCGFEKNEVLQLALWISKQPKGFWKRFHSKEEINNYLKMVLMHAKPSQWAYARRGDPECPSSAGAVAL